MEAGQLRAPVDIAQLVGVLTDSGGSSNDAEQSHLSTSAASAISDLFSSAPTLVLSLARSPAVQQPAQPQTDQLVELDWEAVAQLGKALDGSASEYVSVPLCQCRSTAAYRHNRDFGTLHYICDMRCSEAADLAVQQATKLLSSMAVDGGRLDLWLSAQVCWPLQLRSLRMQCPGADVPNRCWQPERACINAGDGGHLLHALAGRPGTRAAAGAAVHAAGSMARAPCAEFRVGAFTHHPAAYGRHRGQQTAAGKHHVMTAVALWQLSLV